MKRITASDARKNWFRLLDEVAGGEVVSIQRGGRTIVLSRAPSAQDAVEVPDYSAILSAEHLEEADQWSWEWPGPEGELKPESRHR
ncbi:MAG: hypothetical protein FJ207_09310 [Gemmatimonadetes bacterium]|nr:hypothetical protein [Gemmatimonadota bacterium]